MGCYTEKSIPLWNLTEGKFWYLRIQGMWCWRQCTCPHSWTHGSLENIASVRNGFFWPKMRKDVTSWCAKCDVCAARKSPQKKRREPWQKYQVGVPMERVLLDISGPWPVSQKGNRYILVVLDHAEAWPIPDQEAQTVAWVLVEQFVAKFGYPMIHTDKGRKCANYWGCRKLEPPVFTLIQTDWLSSWTKPSIHWSLPTSVRISTHGMNTWQCSWWHIEPPLMKVLVWPPMN